MSSVVTADLADLELRILAALCDADGLLPIPVHDYGLERPHTGRVVVIDSLAARLDLLSAFGVFALTCRGFDLPDLPEFPASWSPNKKVAPWGKKSRFTPGNSWKGKRK